MNIKIAKKLLLPTHATNLGIWLNGKIGLYLAINLVPNCL